MSSLRVGQHEGEWAVFDDEVDALLPRLMVGNDHLSEQWAHWWISYCTAPGDTPPWIEEGLRAFTNRDRSVLYVFNGEPVGTLGWNGAEWWFYGLESDGSSSEFAPLYIDVDDEARQRYEGERQQIAASDPSIQPTLQTELEGRMRIVRDETYELAHLRAMFEAKKRWRLRKAERERLPVERSGLSIEQLKLSGLSAREIAELKGMSLSAVAQALQQDL